LTNAINATKLNDLEKLMGILKDDNLRITSFSNLITIPK